MKKLLTFLLAILLLAGLCVPVLASGESGEIPAAEAETVEEPFIVEESQGEIPEESNEAEMLIPDDSASE